MSFERRAAEIRLFTRPGHPVPTKTLSRYSQVAAAWETYRVKVQRDDCLGADAEKFVALTGEFRSLVDELGLPLICTAESASAEAVVGVTDRNGFLSKDPVRILFATTWHRDVVADD
ncbi:hypothetical protein [Mycobacterium sp. EPa45]|uniref:hypothetical protein n=1 Tax=Mycobacterium sp. EPa45 TaxID=1545728 RepID=UPI0006422378|nr:hypothetical protein [Mycobacterium sp. EPa45]AKK28707.1 hypothetical protein AB431_20815 [Mycobacterium sp. EPa45]